MKNKFLIIIIGFENRVYWDNLQCSTSPHLHCVSHGRGVIYQNALAAKLSNAWQSNTIHSQSLNHSQVFTVECLSALNRTSQLATLVPHPHIVILYDSLPLYQFTMAVNDVPFCRVHNSEYCIKNQMEFSQSVRKRIVNVYKIHRNCKCASHANAIFGRNAFRLPSIYSNTEY